MVGKYISFKWVDCWGSNVNVDVGTIGIFGEEGEKTGDKPTMGEIASELGILPAKKKLINDLNTDTIPFVEAGMSVIV